MVRNKLYLLLLIACGLCGCERYYYKPNGVNAPLLTKAKELHASASFAGGGDSGFTDVQAAWSPINHLGVIGNFSTYRYNGDANNPLLSNVKASAHLAEAGAGYYYAGGKKVKLVADIYGGAGGGAMHSDVDMNFFRWFVQPGLGIRYSIFELSYNYRLCNIRYYNFDANGNDYNYLVRQNLVTGDGRRIDKGSYFFSEPAVTLRLGYKFVKLQIQFVTSNAVSKIPWHYNNGLFNMGINFQLEELMDIVNKKRPVKGG